MSYYIYKLNVIDSEDCYIGRTGNLKNRICYHKSNTKTSNRDMYKTIRENNGFTVEILDMTYDQGHAKDLERQYYEIYKPSLNSNIPNRTIKEYFKKYYLENRDAIIERGKEFYKKNHDRLLEYSKKRYYTSKVRKLSDMNISYESVTVSFD